MTRTSVDFRKCDGCVYGIVGIVFRFPANTRHHSSHLDRRDLSKDSRPTAESTDSQSSCLHSIPISQTADLPNSVPAETPICSTLFSLFKTPLFLQDSPFLSPQKLNHRIASLEAILPPYSILTHL